MSQNRTNNPTVVTTEDVGSLVSAMLALSKDPVDSGVEGEGVYLEHTVDEDPNNLKLLLSNGQVFTVRIIAGDR